MNKTKLKQQREDITRKVESILAYPHFNKSVMCLELGITRPTLDTRLVKHNWKFLEIQMINKIYGKL